MSKNIIDLTGMRFGRLVVVEFAGRNKHGHILWRCQCDCGEEVIKAGTPLKRGLIRSCGCYRVDVARENKTIHGHRYERTYNIWKHMIKRCDDENDNKYDYYGGRGIHVCDDWRNNYEDFRDWSLEHGYTDDLSLDRINNNGDYSPENCRWVDRYTQMNNTRRSRHITNENISHSISEWSRILGVHKATLRDRINRGDMSDFEKYFSNCS